MFVYFLSGELWKGNDFAGVQHRFSQAGNFSAAQPAYPGGHQPGRHLVVGNFAPRVARDQKIDLFAGVFSRIAFFADEVNGAHEYFRRTGSLTSANCSVKRAGEERFLAWLGMTAQGKKNFTEAGRRRLQRMRVALPRRGT